ncbi:MAG: hypothetical protein EZS28_024678 [Streblomastix strix]|uniref:Uncharacterized protein n=1 Tax=Streblomastix strix TaxID=222440 RepID=A0A5J4VBD9_9EUKA|nr:MAG: hypothetical protein EZS28_024678 [Streblomastix strix]
MIQKENQFFSLRKKDSNIKIVDSERGSSVGAFDFDSACNILPRLAKLLFSPIEQHAEIAVRTALYVVITFGQRIKLGMNLVIESDDDQDRSNSTDYNSNSSINSESEKKVDENKKKLTKDEIEIQKKRKQQCTSAFAQINEILASAESLVQIYGREHSKTKVAQEAAELVQAICGVIS